MRRRRDELDVTNSLISRKLSDFSYIVVNIQIVQCILLLFYFGYDAHAHTHTHTQSNAHTHINTRARTRAKLVNGTCPDYRGILQESN